jgi:hypothetical protein
MACLPPGLTTLSLGPLLPLTPQLFANIASSCSALKALHASFTHTAAAGVPSGAAQQQLGPLGGDELMDADQQQQQQQQRCTSVSEALGALQHLQLLELVLLSGAERSELPTLAAAAAARRGSSLGGALSPPAAAAAAGAAVFGVGGSGAAFAPLNVAGGGVDAAAEGATVEGGYSSSRGVQHVQLKLGQLPRSLRQLKLSGSWQLWWSTATATPGAAGATDTMQQQQQQLSSHIEDAAAQQQLSGHNEDAAAQQLQQQPKQKGSVCKVCKGKASAAAAASLCDCLQGLQLVGNGLSVGQQQQQQKFESASLNILQQQHRQQRQQQQQLESASILQQQQQPQQGPDWQLPPGGRVSSSSSSSTGSPVRPPLSGLKRPASYPAVQQLPAAAAAAAAGSGIGLGNGLVPAAAAAAAGAGDSLLLRALWPHPLQQQQQHFVFDQQPVLQKRSRSFSSMGADGTTAAAAAAAVFLSAQQESASPAKQQQQQQQMPELEELCLFRVQVSYESLSALVAAAGTSLRKLQLLQLSVTGKEGPLTPQQQQQQQGYAANNNSSSNRGTGHLTTQQLLQLPAAWGCLQQLHIHPYHLWGMLSAGCMVQQPAAVAAAAGDKAVGSAQQQQQLAGAAPAAAAAMAAASITSSSNSSGSSSQPPLQHLTQLLNLRHLYVVNAPLTFASATPPNPITLPSLAARIPSVALPLHDPAAMTALLAAMQEGLLLLPSLRQLLLYMGPATPTVVRQSEGEGLRIEGAGSAL